MDIKIFSVVNTFLTVRNYKLMLLIFLLHFMELQARDLQINLCANYISEYPALFREGDITKGFQADIIEEAVKSLKGNVDIKLVYNFEPWLRCLNDLHIGAMDAVVTASYNAERAVYLNYPQGVSNEKSACDSPYKIICTEFVVFTHQGLNFTYDGKPTNLPKPIRLPLGYSIATTLEQLGLPLETSKGEEQTLQQLVRDKTGCVIMAGDLAREYIKKPPFNDKLIVQKTPFTKKSYYVPFSKKTKISVADQVLFWNAISRISQNEQLVHEIYKKYP